jgi:predicted amidohydrolase
VVTADDTPVGRLGLTVCYDIRFPALFEALGKSECDVIAIPAAFTAPTGAAHWHLLQRARAVEASAWVVAAAQVGQHADGRRTYGHSLVVDPWGEVVLDMGGEAPGLGFAEIDPQRTAEVRAQLPSLANRRAIAT